MESTFDSLVKRLKNEDISALGEVYELLNKKVYNRCVFMLKNKNLAQDATQEIFLKAFTRINSLKDSDRLEAWINQMTYNYCIDYFRSQRKIVETQLLDGVGVIDTDLLSEIDKLNDSEDVKAELMIAIEDLKEVDRTILLMHYWEGYSIKEIAEQLSLGESALKMRLMRTRSKLKDSLEKKGVPYSLEIIILLLLNLV